MTALRGVTIKDRWYYAVRSETKGMADAMGGPAMIVSASYKTDIPAFFGPWFMNRLKAGFVRVLNPYGGPPFTVELGPDAVDGFVFWSRDAAPFAPVLHEIGALGYAFILHWTLTAYPRPLEAATLGAPAALGGLRAVARAFGVRACVWRYDPILFTSLTPADWHRDNFAHLARALRGSVDEVVVSFTQIYRKTARNLNARAREAGLSWEDPEPAEKQTLLADLAGIAAEENMALTLCGQPELLTPGVAPAHCIDAERLGAPNAAAKSHRRQCGCWASRDIGDYDSCPQGCVYCYAVSARARAKTRLARHDPQGEFLIPERKIG